jgi:hypothetical protein
VACQKLEQSGGELENKILARVDCAKESVKIVVFCEERGKYFWLDFLLTFSSKEKVRRGA